MSMTAEQETAILEDLPTVMVLSDDTTVDIYRCKVRYLARVTALLNIVLTELGIDDVDKGVDSLQGDTAKININDPRTYLKLFDKCYDELVNLTALLCSLDKDAVEDLELEDMVQLLQKIVAVNKDFFSNRVMPMLRVLNPENQ